MGITSGLSLVGWASTKDFQFIELPFSIIGAMTSMSLVEEDAWLPLMVWQDEMRLLSTTSLCDKLLDLYGTSSLTVSIS